MWSSFFAAMAVMAAFLYAPGYLLFRALRFHRVVSLVMAPLLSVVAYNVLALFYSSASIYATWVELVLPVMGIGAMACIVPFALGKAGVVAFRKPFLLGVDGLEGRTCWLQLACYVLVGLFLVGFVFVGNLGSPDSMMQHFDNVYHIGTIKTFIASGSFSIFDSGMYPEAAYNAAETPFLPGSGTFYPTTWHCIAALAVSSLGVSATLAANALNALVIGVMVPAGVFIVFKAVFADRPLVVWLGAICALAFAAFPWNFLVFGPLYPNILGNALLLLAAVCFFALFRGNTSMKALVGKGALLVVAVAAVALAHPNAVFAGVVLLAPFLCYQVSSLVKEKAPKACGGHIGAVSYAACALLVACVWIALYLTPFMQNGPLSDWWPAYTGKAQAIIEILAVSFKQPAQLALSAAVFLGIAAALKMPKYRWLVVSYLLAGFIFFADIGSDGMIKHVLSGFWYTDSNRTAATLAIACIPLAALGLELLSRAVAAGIRWIVGTKSQERVNRVVAPVVLALVFMAVNYYPNFSVSGIADIKTAFGAVTAKICAQGDYPHDKIYNEEEAAFVKDAKELIPAGSLVINQPNDGSAFAYCTDGIRTYYRYLRGYCGPDETAESVLIRNGLADIASDENVRSAVLSTGAHYVLLLDAGDYLEKKNPYLWTYRQDSGLWLGIDRITDETPGFEVVLSRGDMRLYRITAV